MRVIAKSRLRKYWETKGNERAKAPLNEWYHFCEKQTWGAPQDVKDTLGKASIVADNRVVFDVKGNDYRVVCWMDYSRGAMYIKFVGTHTEYDKIDVETVL